MRPAAQAGDKNAEFTPLALFAFFVNRCRENLHIIIAFSPIGDAFRNRLRQFPSLINCCTIDWFQVKYHSNIDKKYMIICVPLLILIRVIYILYHIIIQENPYVYVIGVARRCIGKSCQQVFRARRSRGPWKSRNNSYLQILPYKCGNSLSTVSHHFINISMKYRVFLKVPI